MRMSVMKHSERKTPENESFENVQINLHNWSNEVDKRNNLKFGEEFENDGMLREIENSIRKDMMLVLLLGTETPKKGRMVTEESGKTWKSPV